MHIFPIGDLREHFRIGYESEKNTNELHKFFPSEEVLSASGSVPFSDYVHQNLSVPNNSTVLGIFRDWQFFIQ